MVYVRSWCQPGGSREAPGHKGRRRKETKGLIFFLQHSELGNFTGMLQSSCGSVPIAFDGAPNVFYDGFYVTAPNARSIVQGPREAIARQLFKNWVVVHFTFVLAAWIASLRKGSNNKELLG